MKPQLLFLFVSALLACVVAEPVFAQKVGLVLSGGGAKGLAHIGVLKALEENNIPIDYIVGTSMGGVVGGMYAAGYTPSQIQSIAQTPAFQEWVNGRLSDEYQYFYSKKDINASWLGLKLMVDTSFRTNIKSDLVNDVPMNFALAELLAFPGARAKYNFDSLMIPFRCLAADIFTQEQIILKSGSLNHALRATLTVPFFYRPIKIEGRYLFDGGVYNNFPVDVAQSEFHPELIIGVNVSSKVFNKYPYGDDERLIQSSALYLLLAKSDSTQVGKNGIYIQPQLNTYTSLDFQYVKEMIQAGYDETIARMPLIRSKVRRYCDKEELFSKRRALQLGQKDMPVGEVHINGLKKKQEKYVRNMFHLYGDSLRMPEVKRAYFKLATDDDFTVVLPDLRFNPATQRYDFILNLRRDRNLKTEVGGVIATRNIQTLYAGFQYNYLKRALYSFHFNLYTGGFYRAAQLKTRISVPARLPFYVEPEFTYNHWDYIRTSEILLNERPPTIIEQYDSKVGLNLAFSYGIKSKVVASAAYVNNLDEYSNLPQINSTDVLDRTKFEGYTVRLAYSTNSLNRKMYASSGSAVDISFRYVRGKESYVPGTTSYFDTNFEANHHWIKAYAMREEYFGKGRYKWGYVVMGTASSQPVFHNYQSTLLAATGFYPLQDSKTLFLPNFRAFNYLGGGMRNVVSLRRNLDCRFEAYAFVPFSQITESSPQVPSDQRFLNFSPKLHTAASASVVFHSPLGPLSMSANYYDDQNKRWGFLFHIGYLLFNPRSLD